MKAVFTRVRISPGQDSARNPETTESFGLLFYAAAMYNPTLFLIAPRTVASTKMTANANPTVGHDTIHACSWCGKALRSRGSGSARVFCCASHRNSFWAACRKLGERVLALDVISVADLRADPTACTLPWKGKASSLAPEEGSTGQAAPEPSERFLVEVPKALVNALAFRDYAICLHERDDLTVILGALLRRGHRPKMEKTKDGVKLLRF